MLMGNATKMNFLKIIILSNFALLIFILSIPGTIALRNTLAVLLIITLALSWLKNKISMKPLFNNKSFRSIILILLIQSIYILIHSFFIADEAHWSLSQYRTQWIYPMIYFTIGIFLASHAFFDKVFKKETLINIIFFTLFAHILFIDLIAIHEYLISGNLLTRYGGLTESAVLANYITNILNSIIIVELIYRYRTRSHVINVNLFFLLIIFILCIFSSIIEGMRFGVISLFFMGLAAGFFFIAINKKISLKVKYFFALSLLIFCSLPLILNSMNDSRWLSLVETFPIAMDTESNLYWQGDESNIPTLSDGKEVSHSNYMRIAWAVKGIEYISKDIFGIGYGKNAFGHAMEKYDGVNSARGYHSHSSIIDFTIGVGLFGLLLWCIFIGKVLHSCAKIFLNSEDYFSLLTIFITSGFFFRSLLDGNMRDHMFKQFFLLLGVSLMLTLYEKTKKTS